MSQGPKIPLMVAEEYASHIIGLILYSCRRVAVAGSIRRQKADVGDIEIVAIPADSPDLFGTIQWPPEPIEDILTKAGFVLKKNGDHYKQFDWDGIDCDLYITTPACWGVIYNPPDRASRFQQTPGHREAPGRAAAVQPLGQGWQGLAWEFGL